MEKATGSLRATVSPMLPPALSLICGSCFLVFSVQAHNASPILSTSVLGAGATITSLASGSDGTVYVTGTAYGPIPVTSNAGSPDFSLKVAALE